MYFFNIALIIESVGFSQILGEIQTTPNSTMWSMAYYKTIFVMGALCKNVYF